MNRRKFAALLWQAGGLLALEGYTRHSAQAQGVRPRPRPTPHSPTPQNQATQTPKNTTPNAAKQAALPQWKQFRSPDGDFSIEFPNPPKLITNTQLGRPRYTTVFGEQDFSVITAPNDSRRTSFTLEEVTQQFRENGEELLAASVAPGVVEVESHIPASKRTGLMRLIFTPSLIYSLSVTVELHGKIDKDTARKFFASFRLTPQAQKQARPSQTPRQPSPATTYTTCTTCRGAGRRACSRCYGSRRPDSVDRQYGNSCRNCYGSGYVACYTCGGSGRVRLS